MCSTAPSGRGASKSGRAAVTPLIVALAIVGGGVYWQSHQQETDAYRDRSAGRPHSGAGGCPGRQTKPDPSDHRYRGGRRYRSGNSRKLARSRGYAKEVAPYRHAKFSFVRVGGERTKTLEVPDSVTAQAAIWARRIRPLPTRPTCETSTQATSCPRLPPKPETRSRRMSGAVETRRGDDGQPTPYCTLWRPAHSRMSVPIRSRRD